MSPRPSRPARSRPVWIRPARFLRHVTSGAAALFLAGAVASGLTASPAMAAGATSTATEPVAVATTDVTWGVRTASTTLGHDRKNFEYEVDPGGELRDALIITNHDAAPLELDLYAADGFTTSSGQLDVATRDTGSTGLGSWVTFGEDRITVPPGASVETSFTVAVPAEATPGDYAGGVITSLMAAGDEEGITVDRRLGIRIHLRVAGDIAPSLAVENLGVDYAGSWVPFGAGDATVTYMLHNTGNARIEAGQQVTLSGPFGLLRRDADPAAIAEAPQLLPGESWEMRVQVDGVTPAFLLASDVTIAPVLVGQDGVTTPLDEMEEGAATTAVPWSALVLLVLLAGFAVGLRALALRRGRRRREAEDARVAEAVEQALRSQEKVTVG